MKHALAILLLSASVVFGQTLTNTNLDGVTNATLNGVLDNDAAATRTALGLGTAATADAIYLNVREEPYNAVGDGVADDTAAIQAALDSTGNIRSVYIPAGTYKLTDVLVFKRSGTHIFGDGKYSTILNQTVAAKHGFAWDGYNGVPAAAATQQCDISNLKLVGLGYPTHTGTGIYARQDSGDTLTGVSTIKNVWIEGFTNGIWAQSFWKLTSIDCQFVDNLVAAKLTKADTFLFSNYGMGASGVTGNTVGFSIEKSTGTPSGGNFGGIMEIGEVGDLDRFIHMTGGSVSVIEPNLERVALGAGQCVAYIQGYSSFRWHGGRIENGAGSSPQAFFRVRCASTGDDAGTIPAISINGLNQGAGGWRVVEFFGDLYHQGSVASTTGALPIVYTATEAGTALVSTTAAAVPAFGSGSPHAINSSYRGRSFYVPIADASAGTDALLVIARDKTNTYARRNLINDSLHKVFASSATVLSSAAGAETALSTTTVPAYGLPEIGWTLRMKVFGSFANNANNKRIRISFGDPAFYTFYDTTSAAFQNSTFEIEMTWIIRAAAQSWISFKCASDDALTPLPYKGLYTTKSFDASNNIRINTTGVAAADIVIQGIIIEAVKGSSEY